MTKARSLRVSASQDVNLPVTNEIMDKSRLAFAAEFLPDVLDMSNLDLSATAGINPAPLRVPGAEIHAQMREQEENEWSFDLGNDINPFDHDLFNNIDWTAEIDSQLGWNMDPGQIGTGFQGGDGWW